MIKSEILITVGMGSPVSSDQWKAPSVVGARTNVILAGKCNTNSNNNNFYLNTPCTLPRSKTPHLQNEAKYTTCPVKNHFHVKG